MCPPELTGKLLDEPLVPAGDQIPKPKPLTPAAAAALNTHLQFESAHAGWGQEGWRRLGIGQKWCNDPKRK